MDKNVTEGKASLSDIISAFTEKQRERFERIFAAVKARGLRNDAAPEEAEATALAIALSAARNFTPAPENLTLEASARYFTPMMPEQLGRNSAGEITGQEYSFNFIQSNLDIAREIAVGNTFNLDHEHSKPVGVITDVMLASEVPEGIEVDQDAPFVFVASYFNEVSDDIKAIEAISAEWASFEQEDGVGEAIPTTFAVTETPLNGVVNGIKRIAGVNTGLGKPYKEDSSKNEQEMLMSESEASVAELQTKVASLGDELNAANEKLATFKESLAAVAGVKATEDVTVEDTVKATITRLAAVEKETEAYKARLDEVVAAALDKESEDFAASLVKEGKIATEAQDKFAGLFKTIGKEAAEGLAASMTSTTIGVKGLDSESLPEESLDLVKAALDLNRSKIMPGGN